MFFIALNSRRNIWQIAEKTKNKVLDYIDKQAKPLSWGFKGIMYALAIVNDLGVSFIDVLNMNEEKRDAILENILDNVNNSVDNFNSLEVKFFFTAGLVKERDTEMLSFISFSLFCYALYHSAYFKHTK